MSNLGKVKTLTTHPSQGYSSLYDWSALFVIVLINLGVFGYRSGSLGFYADDPTFLQSITVEMTPEKLWALGTSYVPGRNLHMLWQYLLTLAVGGSSTEQVPAMHSVQVFFDILISSVLFGLLRQLNVQTWVAMLCVTLFALFPNHGETHFWLSALPMHLLSTLLVIILLAECVFIINKINAKQRYRFLYLLLTFITYICIVFTYDQAVPVAWTSISILSAILFKKDRTNKYCYLIFWIFCCSIIIVILFLKMHTPGNGPTFTHLSISHITLNVLYSLGIWVFIWFKACFYPIWELLNATDRLLASFVTLMPVIVLIGVLIKIKNLRDSEKQFLSDGNNQSRLSCALIVFGAGFFFIAYIPNYIWSIAPRHSYLPSVGVTFVLAGLFRLAERYIVVTQLYIFSFAICVGLLIFSFVALNLIEKNYWIASYEVRKGIYADRLRKDPTNVMTSLLFMNFPSSLYPTPSLAFLDTEYRRLSSLLIGSIAPAQAFLMYEQPSTSAVFAQKAVTITQVSWHPVRSEKGFYLRTERRWGQSAIIHMPEQQVLVLRCDESAELLEKVKPKARCIDPINRDQLYDLTPRLTHRALAIQFEVSAYQNVYQVHLPATTLTPGETLTLVGYVGSSAKTAPAYYSYKEQDWEEFIIPIDVSKYASISGAVIDLSYTVPMPRLSELRLYAIDELGQRLIASTTVIHSVN